MSKFQITEGERRAYLKGYDDGTFITDKFLIKLLVPTMLAGILFGVYIGSTFL